MLFVVGESKYPICKVSLFRSGYLVVQIAAQKDVARAVASHIKNHRESMTLDVKGTTWTVSNCVSAELVDVNDHWQCIDLGFSDCIGSEAQS